MDRDVESLQWLTDGELVAARREAIRDLNLLRLDRPGAVEDELALRKLLMNIQAVQNARTTS